MKKKLLITFVFAIILLFAWNNKANATYNVENIVDYDIEIHVNEDSSMNVTEKITVNALGKDIVHGIYRDFPTQYRNKVVSFILDEVTLDGETVNYTTESISRGVRIKIGSSNNVVSTGLHTYEIKYTTERQIFFEDEYNEFYWNLIGSGWNFDIEACSAKVYFPEGTIILKDEIKTYVGEYGNSAESDDVYWYVDEENECVCFNMFYKIPSQNAFTVVVRVNRGTISEPTFEQIFKWTIQDNAMYIVIFIGMILLGIWQFFSWKRAGKDPKKNIIIPKYYPPEGLDVADVKYIDTMGESNRILEATIISLATKGFLKFTKTSEKSNTIVIEKIQDRNIDDYSNVVSKNEKNVYSLLKDKETLKYSSSFNDRIQKMDKSITSELEDRYKNKMFFKNYKQIIISIIATVIIFFIGLIVEVTINPYVTFNQEKILFVIALIFIFTMISVVYRSLIKNKSNKFLGFMFMIIWGGPFILIGIQLAITVLDLYLQYLFQAFVVVDVFLQNFFFIKWIPRYSEEGMRIKEDIDGFKMFIKVAKDDDFSDKTPEMFDKYFAYAYVLGLENKWAKKFEEILEQQKYTPTWCSAYMFHNGLFNCVDFTSSFSSSFSTGMSSASTAPSSSSSSGGGGFSGGGGGGRRPVAAGKVSWLNHVKEYKN